MTPEVVKVILDHRLSVEAQRDSLMVFRNGHYGKPEEYPDLARASPS